VNLPDALTLSRLGSAVILMVLLALSFPFCKSLALLVFVLGSITDYLDGHLARNVYGVSPFGALMDPLTDKVMVCAAFVSFVELQLVSAIVVVCIIAREFMVTGLRLVAMNAGKVIAAGKWGKHKTVWQIVAIIIILLGLAIRDDMLGHVSSAFFAQYDLAYGFVAHAVSIAAASITVGSGAVYLQQHRNLLMRQFK